MASELEQRIKSMADIEDVAGMTDLLCQWHEKSPEWLLFVDARLAAPSSTKEQKARLKKIKSDALKENPDLSYESLFNQTEEPSAPQPEAVTAEFNYSQQDQTNYAIIETLDELESWQTDEIEQTIAALNYAELEQAVQHQVNHYVYGLLKFTKNHDKIQHIANSTAYKSWCQRYVAQNVLSNAKFDVSQLITLSELDNQVELIRKKDYYQYLLDNGDDGGSFTAFLAEVGGLNEFSEQASLAEIAKFEEHYQVNLPEELRHFYREAGKLTGTINNPCNILSLNQFTHYLDKSRANYEQLKGLGLIHMLDFIWGNNKDDFLACAGFLDQVQIDYLNTHYKSVGFIHVDDNVNLAIYYDEKERFGAVWYNQDDGSVYDDYLIPLMTKSQAKHGLCQLLASIQWILANPFYQEQNIETFIAELRG